MAVCINCRHHGLCVHRVAIFSPLSAEESHRVAELLVHKEYRKGELIMIEGEQISRLIIVQEGQVKAFRSTADGREQILYIFSSGDFFGEKNLLRNQPASYSVEALVDTRLCMINKSDFEQLLRAHPEIGIKIMEELCRRLERLETAVESLGARDGDARVSSVLLEFAERYGEDHPQGVLVKLPFSRQGIADYVGLTRETVSRKLSSLQAEGVVELIGNKKLLILDKNALESN